jgi:plastocyanin
MACSLRRLLGRLPSRGGWPAGTDGAQTKPLRRAIRAVASLVVASAVVALWAHLPGGPGGPSASHFAVATAQARGSSGPSSAAAAAPTPIVVGSVSGVASDQTQRGGIRGAGSTSSFPGWSPPTYSVDVSTFGFNPAHVEAHIGSTVTFVNVSSTTLTVDWNSWTSGALSPGQHATAKFIRPGTFVFQLRSNPQLSVTIDVPAQNPTVHCDASGCSATWG